MFEADVMKISNNGKVVSVRAVKGKKEKVLTLDFEDKYTLITLSDLNGEGMETWQVNDNYVFHTSPDRKAARGKKPSV